MKQIKHLLLLLLTFGTVLPVDAQDIDIQHYDINLHFNLQQRRINGFTDVKFVAKKQNLESIQLELYKLNVDSVLLNNTKIEHDYVDSLLTLFLPNSNTVGDTLTARVYYNGTPKSAPKGYGGFFIDNTIAYNIGATPLFSQPGTGKTWYPCIENFTEKATYAYKITAPAGTIAICSGSLVDSTRNADQTRFFHWRLREPISTYISSIAVGNFTIINDTVQTAKGEVIPITLAGPPSSVSSMRSYYTNLKRCFRAFESYFGDYVWERVGYISVPFSLGAMEHATNIAMPDIIVMPGGTSFDWVMAHELAHGWFGNNVTCETGGDMWLNEGFARYSEVLFNEAVRGQQAGKRHLRGLQRKVLNTAFTPEQDNDYHAVAPIPHAHIYGTTVYDKGAMVAHTLRHYMSDTAFSRSLRTYFTNFKFATSNTDQFRDRIAQISGQDLTDFFDTWVRQAGHLHYTIDSFIVSPAGDNYTTKVYLRQKSLEKPKFANKNKVELLFMDSTWAQRTVTATYDGVSGVASFTLPFKPNAVFIDPNEKICGADVHGTLVIKQAGFAGIEGLDCNINTATVRDSALVQIGRIYTAPDYFKGKNPGYRLANRYWTIQYVAKNGFKAAGVFASTSDRKNGAAFDSLWLVTIPQASRIEDSLVVLYRKDATEEWRIPDSLTFDYGSLKNDFSFMFTVKDLQPGEYTLAVKDASTVGRDEAFEAAQHFTIYPNPANERITFSRKNAAIQRLIIYDVQGREIERLVWEAQAENTLHYDVSKLPHNLYFVSLQDDKGAIETRRFIVGH